MLSSLVSRKADYAGEEPTQYLDPLTSTQNEWNSQGVQEGSILTASRNAPLKVDNQATNQAKPQFPQAMWKTVEL